MISLNNEWAPTYRARHPHGPSASLRTVVVVVVVNINFLPVAERNKLLILLAVPAVLPVILLVLPAVLAVLLLVLLVLLTSQSFYFSKQNVTAMLN